MSGQGSKYNINQNKQTDQIRVQAEQQSELLNQEQSRTQQDQQDQFFEVCPIPIILTVIFCLLFSMVLYNYVTLVSKVNPGLNLPEGQLFGIQKDSKEPKSQGSQNQQQTSNINGPSPAINNKKYLIPSKVWLFNRTSTSDPSQMSKRHQTSNLKHYSSTSQYQFHQITLQNYKFFINSPTTQKIIQKIKSLQITREQKQQYLEMIIMLSVIQQNGGITLGEGMIAVQNFTWLRQLSQANRDYETYLYMGYSKGDVSRYGVDLKSYFVASTNRNKFLKHLIEQISQVLESEIAHEFNDFQGTSLISQSQQEEEQYFTHIWQQYEQKFGGIIESQVQKLRIIGDSQQDVLHYLKIYSLGSLDRLSMQKNILLNLTIQSQYKYLYSVRQEQLTQMIGPLNPVLQLPTEPGQEYLQNQSQKQDHQIVQGSFICQHLFAHQGFECLQSAKSQEQPLKQWNIPNLMWTFAQPKLSKDIPSQFFLDNLLRISKHSDFQLIILTPENLQLILQLQDLHQIPNNHPQSQQNKKTYYQMIKLKILAKYGGIFVDPNYFLLQNLQWLRNISQSGFVFNKWGEGPQVFMFHRHLNFNWFLNYQFSDVKESLDLDYWPSFIAAHKNSSLINDWLQELNENLQIQNAHFIQKMQKQCSFKSQGKQNIFQDTLKCLIKKKQLNLNTIQNSPSSTSAKFYKIWSMNSLFAGDKMNMVLKEKNKQCFQFDQSHKEFTERYGSLGYISQLSIDGSQQQLQSTVKNLGEDSIFKQFFPKDQIDINQINQRKSTNLINTILGRV